MAEQLGEAVLRLSVDDQALNAGLQRAKTQAERTGQALGQAFSKGGRELQTAANGLQYYIDAQGRARDASGRFVTSLQLQEAGLRNLGSAAASSVGGFDRLGASLGQLVGQLALLETARRVAVFTGQQVQELDSAQAAVRTLGVNSEELTTRLRALSAELGSNVSVIELTKAAYDVASSGFASAGDATQILRAASLGAQGGFAELNDVVRALTGVLNAYGLSADQATSVVDKFVQTQNDGVITVRQYAAEIGNVTGIAAAAGVSLEDLNAAIGAATVKGTPVAQTFTGIRQAISSIIKPTEIATQKAQQLGIDYSAAALKAKGFGKFFEEVFKKTSGSPSDIAILLGSVEAQAPIQQILNDKLETYNKLKANQITLEGQAGKAAEINAATISGGLKQIGNGFSNLATTLDTTLKPLFGGFINSINEILSKLNKVSALAPDRVLARQKEAQNLVQNAIGPFGGSGFFGDVTVQYDGKTFKGTAAGVANDITNYLLNKELAAINKPAPSSGSGTSAGGQVPAPTVDTEALDKQRKAAAQAELNDLTAKGFQDELRLKKAIIGLEVQSLLAGQGISATTRTQLDNLRAILAARQQVGQAEIALNAELAKPANQRSSAEVDNLLFKVDEANASVRKAYLDAGLSLVQNARTAADALKNAQDNLQGILRGGFEFLTPQLQQQQLARARAAIQPQVDAGIIRSGIDISTPDKLFRVAAFAEQLAPAQKQLEDAVRENAAATSALSRKDWNVYVSVPGQATPVPLPRV